LKAALAAHLRYEHAGGVRRIVSRLQIALGVPVWLSAARADWIPSDLRRLVLAAWVVSFAGLLWAGFVEWRCHRRCIRLAEAPSPATQVGPTGCADEPGEAI
jgi:hypothetical protein